MASYHPTFHPIITLTPSRSLPPRSPRRLSLPATPRPASFDISYHLHTLYLFTCNDLKFVVYPTIAFAFFSHLAAPAFKITVEPNLHELLCALPSVALWTWLNLLPFVIDNQRDPTSVAEDRINKPWRPIASGRLTVHQATILMLVSYPICFSAGYRLSLFWETLALTLLGLWHNTFGGANWDPVTRNFLCAAGYFAYNAGAGRIALQTGVYDIYILTEWTTAISAIIMTTIQLQDMYDQRGDATRNRKTIPLLIGDGPARWTIAIPMAFWSIVCPWYWRSNLAGYLVCTGLGSLVALRTLLRRSEVEDKKTMKLWTVWLLVVYSMPFVKQFSR